MKKLYSTREFARLAGVSVSTLKRLRRSGKFIPKMTDTRVYQYSDKDVDLVRGSMSTDRGFNVNLPNDKSSCNAGSGDEIIIMSEKNSETQKIQVNPTTNLVRPIDKLSKAILRSDLSKNPRRNIIECKRPRIITPLKIEIKKVSEEFQLSAFDVEVFQACVTHQAAGNEYATISTLYHIMGGGHILTAETKRRIHESLTKLSFIRLDFDMSEVCELYGYNDGAGFRYSGSVLPFESIRAEVNGQIVEGAIHFLAVSPLLKVAQIKSQFVTANQRLLDVPYLKNTENIVGLKGYLLERILQIKGSYGRKPKTVHNGKKKIVNKVKPLQKIILFDTLQSDLKLQNLTKSQWQDLRQAVTKILKHFKSENLIATFELKKVGKKFYSIAFDWQQDKENQK